MKIAILSDTHDNLTTLKKAVDWINKNGIEEIIHCGDICSAGTLKELDDNFSGRIHIVFGNVDGDIFPITRNSDAGVTPNVIIYHELGEVEIDSKKIAFIHRPKLAKILAESGKYDLVFYGHTHKPWEEKVDNCRLINPGTLAGMFQKATFAIYDTKIDKLELKIVERL